MDDSKPSAGISGPAPMNEELSKSKTPRSPWRAESFALTMVVVGLAMWRFGGMVADPDLWGHLRFGIDKIEAGRYLSEDIYSYLTTGQTWFNHEWLGEVAMGGVYLWLGPAGLVVVKALMTGLVVVFLTWWLLRLRIPPVRVAIFMTLAILLLTPTFGTFRPQVFTTVLFTATLALVATYSTKRSRWIWILPAIFLLWVNVHGGVLSGIAVVWAWAAVYFVSRRERGWEPVVVAGAGSAALLLNPNGLAHIRFLIETTTVSRPEIVEWSSLDLLGPAGLGYVVVTALLIAALISSRHDLDLTLVIPLIGLMVAPLIAWRHLQLFVPAAVILGGPYLARLSSRDTTRPAHAGRRSRIFVGLMVVVAMLSGAFVVGRVARASTCVAIDASQFEFPSRAVQALALANVTGNAVVPFNWGEYIIWHLGPSVQVSVDGRRETIYSEEVLSANLDFANGGSGWDRVLNLAPAEVVIQTTGTPGATMMATEPGWRQVYEDPTATIFVPTASSLRLHVDETIPHDGNGLCLDDEGPPN